MAEPVEFPDAEQLLIDSLGDELDPIPVRLTIPNPRAEAFLIVQRVGGVRRDLVTDAPLLIIEAWDNAGPTAAKALLGRARTHIAALRGTTLDGVAVYSVTELSGPAFLPDPESNQTRYTYSVQVALRGSVPTGS